MSTVDNTMKEANDGQEVCKKKRIPAEVSILLVLVGISIMFEILGWIFVGQSFLMNMSRLQIIILQVSVIGIIAIGVTMIIITGGIDLSSGSVVAMSAMIAATFAQSSSWPKVISPSLTDLPFVIPLAVGLAVGAAAGFVNGWLVTKTRIPPFIATLGMMVSARGVARWYTDGSPVSGFTNEFAMLGNALDRWMPVVIFIVVAIIFHVVMRYTRFGKFTYAIGANPQAARVSGINIDRHLIKVYAIAGLLVGLAAMVAIARIKTAQAGMGLMYELDAIAAAVIGGVSLSGGRGRIAGTVIGALILGVMLSGFTFLRIDAYYQDIIKGAIIVTAVIIDQQRQNKRKKTT
ncbi:monosaccharide ABC transporter membrane protein (CUT2 family) [Marinomonas alcarazii]|jgi:inositol transport system permease protein|uniref:Monosaccharide ABC transporter membrane protein (CUT2 family) n=1 Tax=Marinomonas alcarazii TaxID=491949 RepID=A0A318V8G7_9GAMM|nr:ABC transporter permease [Marinomonas alcarazii]PYF84121.1 monosaccharide ABC transporter membrane protein (CUT2 family) [Marinomonas alcarazii]